MNLLRSCMPSRSSPHSSFSARGCARPVVVPAADGPRSPPPSRASAASRWGSDVDRANPSSSRSPTGTSKYVRWSCSDDEFIVIASLSRHSRAVLISGQSRRCCHATNRIVGPRCRRSLTVGTFNRRKTESARLMTRRMDSQKNLSVLFRSPGCSRRFWRV